MPFRIYAQGQIIWKWKKIFVCLYFDIKKEQTKCQLCEENDETVKHTKWMRQTGTKRRQK